MTRYFEPISREELEKKVFAVASRREGEGLCLTSLFEKLGKDVKVEFDLENIDTGDEKYGFGPAGLTGLVSLGNGLTFWGMAAGGDWEQPVFWIVYWDGKKLRAYVPIDGNPWNTKTKKAYGNDDEADLKNVCMRWPHLFRRADLIQDPPKFDDIDLEFDPGLILNDILGHVLKKEGK